MYNITSFTAIDCQVKESLPTINNPVVVLGTPMQTGTTKLSVISEEDVALVHLNFHSTNPCFGNCQKGESNARLMNKKKVPKSVSIQEHYSMCGHIQTLFANMEILENIFPDYFRSSSTNDEMKNGNYNMNTENTCHANTEDKFIDHDSKSTENFNKSHRSVGIWRKESTHSKTNEWLGTCQVSIFLQAQLLI